MIIVKVVRQAWYLAFFVVYFCIEVVRANLRIAMEVATPKFGMDPGIRAVRVETRNNFELSLLASMITLTPGTLSLEVSEDRRTIFVHMMYRTEIEEFRAFETRLLRAVRWS